MNVIRVQPASRSWLAIRHPLRKLAYLILLVQIALVMLSGGNHSNRVQAQQGYGVNFRLPNIFSGLVGQNQGQGGGSGFPNFGGMLPNFMGGDGNQGPNNQGNQRPNNQGNQGSNFPPNFQGNPSNFGNGPNNQGQNFGNRPNPGQNFGNQGNQGGGQNGRNGGGNGGGGNGGGGKGSGSTLIFQLGQVTDGPTSRELMNAIGGALGNNNKGR